MTDHDFRPLIAAKDAEIAALKAERDKAIWRTSEALGWCDKWKRKAEDAEAQLTKAREDTARLELYMNECDREFQISATGDGIWYCDFSDDEDIDGFHGQGDTAANAFRAALDAIDAAREKSEEA